MKAVETLPTKSCDQMTNQELADFIDMGAWRENSHEADATAYKEAAKRLRVRNKWRLALSRQKNS